MLLQRIVAGSVVCGCVHALPLVQRPPGCEPGTVAGGAETPGSHSISVLGNPSVVPLVPSSACRAHGQMGAERSSTRSGASSGSTLNFTSPSVHLGACCPKAAFPNLCLNCVFVVKRQLHQLAHPSVDVLEILEGSREVPFIRQLNLGPGAPMPQPSGWRRALHRAQNHAMPPA
jgi:hypothetical protein